MQSSKFWNGLERQEVYNGKYEQVSISSTNTMYFEKFILNVVPFSGVNFCALRSLAIQIMGI